MIFLHNIVILLKCDNILKLEYEDHEDNDEYEILCLCCTCDFIRYYINPIIKFFFYKLNGYEYK